MSNILSIPFKENKKLKTILDFVDGSIELQTLWKCANIQAIDRLGYNDHGPVHVKIVSNRALKILRMLLEKNIEPGVKSNYGMTLEDSEVVVVLASIMHDLGMAVIREGHEIFSAQLAKGILEKCLKSVYTPEEEAIITSEVLHAIVSHHIPAKPLTLEAGIVRIADALDMEQGRARIPYEAGKINIHSVSALSIKKVDILEGEDSNKPIKIIIEMSNPAGIFQVDSLLGTKIKDSGLEDYIRVEAIIGDERKHILFDKGFRD
ncbi:HD domain-containing protein [Candidatus Bathyarchaeota archaeon]|nr:HD domain-containing protein [Candidatus Bathyarchaeota archaeon]MBS7630741.1 HD domain-containing protein [Candidatus Bathyarchaeota archaeon]